MLTYALIDTGTGRVVASCESLEGARAELAALGSRTPERRGRIRVLLCDSSGHAAGGWVPESVLFDESVGRAAA